MKKTIITFFAVAWMVSFAACNETKKTGAENGSEAVETEVAAPEAPAPVEVAPAEALKAFQDFAKEYGEAFNNITKDPGKYTRLAGQVQEKVTGMERRKAELTPAQIKNYEKALKIITDVNSGGSKK
ncbi:MAG: hypothetical protein LBH61_04230 [Dysgonamonadaceae bacterium]|jgi:hypothetical protein|nr:hypothetical protein [Dysgonamonadaceae bacterium]